MLLFDTKKNCHLKKWSCFVSRIYRPQKEPFDIGDKNVLLQERFKFAEPSSNMYIHVLKQKSLCSDCLWCALSARCVCGTGSLPSGHTEGQWRIGWQPIRPVLKHGPRSLTCTVTTCSVFNCEQLVTFLLGG